MRPWRDLDALFFSKVVSLYAGFEFSKHKLRDGVEVEGFDTITVCFWGFSMIMRFFWIFWSLGIMNENGVLEEKPSIEEPRKERISKLRR